MREAKEGISAHRPGVGGAEKEWSPLSRARRDVRIRMEVAEHRNFKVKIGAANAIERLVDSVCLLGRWTPC